MDDFRRFFLRGLAALGPTLLTVAILVWVFTLVNDHVGVHVTKALVLLCSTLSDEPAPGFVDEANDPLTYGTPIDEWRKDGRRLTTEYKVITHRILHENNGLSREVAEAARAHAIKARNAALWQIAFVKYKMHLLGFLIAVILVYFTGVFLASFLGRRMWRAGEHVLDRIPLIRGIYPHVKQVTDFLLSERKSIAASGVVAVEYPRRGTWSLGLSTGAALSAVVGVSGEDMITVFIPSSPTPITGYVIQVPRKDVIEMDMTIDEALRFTVSGGVIKPGTAWPVKHSDENVAGEQALPE